MPKNPTELEAAMLDIENWSKAPGIVHEMAEMSSRGGVFTGIAWDDYYGWTILVRDPNARIGWCERNLPEQPGSEDIDYADDFWNE